MAPLTLLCATNSDLLFAAATLLHSIQAHTSVPLDVWCFVDGLPDAMKLRFRQFCERSLSVSLTLVEPGDLSVSSQRTLDRMVGARDPRWRPALARLVMAQDLPERIDRALYLDVDAIALADLAEATTLPLAGRVLGAVQAPLAALTGRVGVRRYLNSGVLLVDCDKWRAHEVTDRCAHWLVEDAGASRLADQDALNVVLDPARGEPCWEPLPPAWNALPALFVDRGKLAYDPVAPDEIIVLHYAGPLKPWRREGHPLAHLYARHLAAVPFRPASTSGGLFG